LAGGDLQCVRADWRRIDGVGWLAMAEKRKELPNNGKIRENEEREGKNYRILFGN